MLAKLFRKNEILPGIRKFSLTVRRRQRTSDSEAVKWEDAKPYDSIPGPKPLPLFNVGNLWRFTIIGPYWNLEPEKFLLKLREDYGGIIRMRGIGQKDFLFVSDAEAVEVMFRHEVKAPVRESIEVFKYYQENIRPDIYSKYRGLAVLQGDRWISARNNLNPILMQVNSAKPHLKEVETVADEFIERMKYLRDDNSELPDDYADELGKWALESLAYAMIDKRFGFLSDEKSEEAVKIVNAVRISFDTSFILELMPFLWQYVSTPAWRRFVKNMNVITQFLYQNVIEKCREIENRKGSRHGEREGLLEAMIRAEDAEFAAVLATDLLLAGVDTVSNAVATMLVFLAKHPEKQEKLFQEIKAILPEKDTPLTETAFANMKYLKAVFKESFRLRPVSPGNTRTTVKDMVLSGYRIPKGTRLFSLGLQISMDERYFKKPHEFVPERWLKTGEKSELSLTPGKSFAFIPFGFGSRMCVGKRFADLEIETIMAKLIRNFEFSYHHGEMEWHLLLFLKVNKSLKFKITDRPS